MFRNCRTTADQLEGMIEREGTIGHATQQALKDPNDIFKISCQTKNIRST
jgi:hypothetical protein